MQTIYLDDARYQKFRDQAAAAGYQDVAAYLAALVDEAAFDPRGGMSDEQLCASAAECDAIAKRMEAGNEQDARQALSELGRKFGLKPPE